MPDTFRAVRARPMRNRLLIPTARFFPDGVDPDCYCMVGNGTCMLPEIGDGWTVIISPAAQPKPGDNVVIWWKCGSQPLNKRLIELPSPENGNRLIFATLNPFRRVWSRGEIVDRVHKIVGVMTPAEHDEAVDLHAELDQRPKLRPDFIADGRGNVAFTGAP